MAFNYFNNRSIIGKKAGSRHVEDVDIARLVGGQLFPFTSFTFTNGTTTAANNVFATSTGLTTLGGGAVNISATGTATTVKGTLNVDEAVSGFTIINPPAEATAFTIKVVQGSTAFSVGIDTFTNNATGAGATVYWPGGNVPVVTQTAGKIDIYSFKSFDSCKALFGITGGQNFSN